MDNPNPIRYSDLIQPDNSITDLIKQLKDLEGEYEQAKTKIQGAAADAVKSIQGMSGATEEQRKNITLVTEQSDKWLKSLNELDDELLATKRAQAEINAANKEAAQIAKLTYQANHSAKGSYNQLSAQYRLNKMALNEMTAEERRSTEFGKQLEQETAALYEEMKRLQEATGMHQLNVGNYADAAKGLKTELMSLTQQMAYLKTQGQESSEEYQQMAQRAGQLKDAMMDAQQEVKAMSSDTQQLDATMGAASAAGGGMAAVTGSMALMGQTSETATDAQKNLGAAVGIVSGLTAVQNALQKQSNVMTGIRILQTKAATKAEQLDAAAKKKNTAVTVGATVAQKVFNAVAAANPYVLLAMALITVVGALVAFSAGANRASKEQTKLNKATAANLDYLEEYSKQETRVNEERAQELQNELDIAKARKAGLSEIRELEDQIYNERVKAHDKQMIIYKEQVDGIEANRAKLEQLQKTLRDLKLAQAAGKNKVLVDVDLDGNVERQKVDKAIEAVQGQIDNYGREVEIGVSLKQEGKDLAKERAQQLAQRREEAKQIAKTELDVVRGSQDARIALIKDSFKKEAVTLKVNAQRQIEDIKTRLKTETNLTKKAREALNQQIKAITAKYYQDLSELRDQYFAINLQARRETEDLEIAVMAEGAEKQRKELEVSYTRQINDLQNALATRKDLTQQQRDEMLKQIELLWKQYNKALKKLNQDITTDELGAQATRIQNQLDATKEGSQEYIDLRIALLKKQRDIELAENAKLADGVRQDESEINKKWDAIIFKETSKLNIQRANLILDQEENLAQSEFNLLNKNERQKTLFAIEQEKKRIKKIIELAEKGVIQLTDAELKAYKNALKGLDKERDSLGYNNIFEVLGLNLDSKQQEAITTAVGAVKDLFGELIDSWEKAGEAAVQSAEKQVSAAQSVLDAQIDARDKGYASDVKTAQKELALAKKNHDKALKENQRAQRAQILLDSASQASSLITASANIWSGFSKIQPAPLGIALAIAALATMWGSFAISKVKALQMTAQTETYGEGTVELLQGGSHASGHDIDLGTKPNGTKRRAEGGEFFAVINKRNSRRYRNVIPDVINSFNDGSFADKYMRANSAMSGSAVQIIGGTDVSNLEKSVDAIRRQGDETRTMDGSGNIIIRRKNLTRKIVS